VAHAGHTVGAVLALGHPGLVAVVTPRESGSPTRSVPEVLGAVASATLRALVAAEPARAGDDVAAHHTGVPAAVGAGENAAAAVARLDAEGGNGPVLVLVDGRAVALVTRAELEQAPGGRG
jgi:hypothetical protein